MLPLTGEMPRINAVLTALTVDRLHLEFGWSHCGSADSPFDHMGNVFSRDLNGLGIASLHHDTRQWLGSRQTNQDAAGAIEHLLGMSVRLFDFRERKRVDALANAD